MMKTYELKLQLTKYQEEFLDSYFYEAKCLYNDILAKSQSADFNIFKMKACSVKEVTKLDKDKNCILVALQYLPAKLKQNVHRVMCDSIKSLSKSKKKGHKVGRLRFKSELNTLEIDNQSIRIIDKSHIRLAGFGRKYLKVFGLHQLGEEYKIANAKLLRRSNGFYVNLCVHKKNKIHEVTGNVIGIDFGIKDSYVLSNGEKISCKIKESVRLKKLSRRINRSYLMNQSMTNNWHKLIKKLQTAYYQQNNQKKDFVNKLIHYLDTNFDKIVFQDEQIKGWHKSLFGSSVQHSTLGKVKRKLMQLANDEPDRYLIVDKWQATTMLCNNCGCKNKPQPLDKRIFICEHCGHEEDRDIHSAKNMLILKDLTKNTLGYREINACGHKGNIITLSNNDQCGRSKKNFNELIKKNLNLNQVHQV